MGDYKIQGAGQTHPGWQSHQDLNGEHQLHNILRDLKFSPSLLEMGQGFKMGMLCWLYSQGEGEIWVQRES